MKQLTVNPDAENWRDKFDNEHENIVRTTESNPDKPYTETTFIAYYLSDNRIFEWLLDILYIVWIILFAITYYHG